MTSSKIPKAWCPECRTELRPYEVLLDRCPECGAILDNVLVDKKTAREIR